MRAKTNFRRTKSLRIVLVCSFSILLILASFMFYRQYAEYRKAEERLVEMYSSANTTNDDLNQLFSLIANSENAFRLYTLDYDAHTFKQYINTLDSVKHYLDSLAVLPIASNPLAHTPENMVYRNTLANEYTLLKKTVEQLVEHAHDSLELITYVLPTRFKATGVDMDRALTDSTKTVSDTIIVVEQDTIVRKRKSLFRRIFDRSDDTIVVDVKTTHLSRAGEPQVTRSVTSPYSTTLASAQLSNLDMIRSSFAHLQEKERDLVQANFALLNSVRNGVDKIRLMKMNTDRAAEKQDFDRYRSNTNIHNKQLVLLLCMMLAMIAVLWYYVRRVTINEIELEKERSQVSKLADEKSAILAGISHEIRTPLSALLGTVDLMRNDPNLYQGSNGETYKQLIDSSYDNLNGVNLAITDILNLSKLESGNEDIVMKYFSPFEAFHLVISLQQQQLRLKGLSLINEININPNLWILSNEFRVKQITTNLIGNAIKYTPSGHVTLKADILELNKQMKLRIEVQDTGIGIPTKHLPNIFRKYYTVEETKNPSAFGLGLYITKLLTDELHGDISVTSEEGRGSTFIVEIPFKKSKIEQPTLSFHDDELALSKLPENLRYLVIDDNPINILYMQQFLSSSQKHVDTANNPKRALTLLDERPYDIVITDINMPDMDGWELLETIRSSGKYPHLKVLALSADTLGVETKNASMDSTKGFDGIIPKPFTEADFARVILQAINSPNNQEVT